jgi:hypothetical protein
VTFPRVQRARQRWTKFSNEPMIRETQIAKFECEPNKFGNTVCREPLITQYRGTYKSETYSLPSTNAAR